MEKSLKLKDVVDILNKHLEIFGNIPVNICENKNYDSNVKNIITNEHSCTIFNS